MKRIKKRTLNTSIAPTKVLQSGRVRYWLRTTFKTPRKCECCGSKTSKIEYVLRPGMKYEFKRENFIALCRSCRQREFIPHRQPYKKLEELKTLKIRMHQWLHVTFGKPDHCDFCGKDKPGRYEYALKHERNMSMTGVTTGLFVLDATGSMIYRSQE